MEKTIITSETPTSSSHLTGPSRIVCRVCQKQFSQYTCPRCNTRYCSLPCYKSHSVRCNESFMKDNVLGELGQLEPDDKTKQKMVDILKRFHSEEETDSMDEDDSPISEETMLKLIAGNQLSYDDLSLEEKKHFQRAMASGELSKLIKPWEPWWLKPSARTLSLSRFGTPLVQPLPQQEAAPTSRPNDPESGESHEIPPGPETPLPPLTNLSRSEPSPLLALHLVDIIYSYCFTLRLYNGDWKSDPMGSAMVVLSISSVLGHGGQPETVFEALSPCLEQTCSPAFKDMGGLRFGLGLLDDIVSLLSLGGSALVCLLCDLQRLFQAAEKEMKAEKRGKSSSSTQTRSKMKQAEKKIYFVMCWVHEQPEAAWSSLAAMVEAEKGSAMEFAGNHGETLRVQSKVKNIGKSLIEEVQ